MELTPEEILALSLNDFSVVFDNAMSWDMALFNTVLFANIMAYITGHVLGRVMALMRKS